VGAGSGRAATPDERRVGGRLDSRKAQRDGKDSTGRVRRDQLSQLRQAGAVRKENSFLAAVRSAADLHGIHGTRNGSTFEGSLPIAKKYNVAAINWGLVAGKTQTYLPWDSWRKPYTDHEPAVWFHEIFRTDGKPYKEEEVELIKKLTGRPAK